MFEKLASILGGNLMSGVSDIIGKFVTDPTKLMEANAELEKLKSTTEIRLAEVASQDRNSARQREAAVKDLTPSVLMYACTAGFFGILAYMLAYDVPQGNERILDMMLGSLGTAWIMGWSYYYGSSTGSASKQTLISKLTTNKE